MTAIEMADVVAPVLLELLAVRDTKIAALEATNADLVHRYSDLAHQVAELAARPQPRDGKDGLNGKDGAPGLNGNDGIDGKDGAMGPSGPPGPAGERGERGLEGAQGQPGRDGRDGAPGAQGEKGLDGAPGRDGVNGKDGRDGTLEQLGIVVDDEQDTATFVRADGTAIAGGVIRLYRSKYVGTYSDDLRYQRNQRVFWGNKQYEALREGKGIKPDDRGEGSRMWALVSMPGRQGKDGKPGPPGPPGPKGEPGPPGRNGYSS